MVKSNKEGTIEKKSLAIVGSAPTLAAAPYTDPSFEIWAHSTTLPAEEFKRADRAFEFHPRRYWGMPNVTERLSSFKGPVYMQEHTNEIPNSVRYPIEEIRKEFLLGCMQGTLYVTNSITYMILLAIYEGYKDLHLFGVHMAHETEYGYQQPSCSWALGIAQGRGCSIWLPPESQLLKARYEYGYQEPTKAMQHVDDRIAGLEKGINQITQNLNQTAAKKARTEGALSEAIYWQGYLSGTK